MADPGDFRTHSHSQHLCPSQGFPIPFSNEECSDYWKPLASEDAFPNPGIKTYSPMVNNS